MAPKLVSLRFGLLNRDDEESPNILEMQVTRWAAHGFFSSSSSRSEEENDARANVVL